MGDIYFSLLSQLSNDSDVGVMASISKPLEGDPFVDWEFSLILYNSNDTSNKTSSVQMNLSVDNLPPRRDVTYVLYKLDNTNGNPYGVWREMDSPVFPTEEQFKELRRHQVSV